MFIEQAFVCLLTLILNGPLWNVSEVILSSACSLSYREKSCACQIHSHFNLIQAIDTLCIYNLSILFNVGKMYLAINLKKGCL